MSRKDYLLRNDAQKNEYCRRYAKFIETWETQYLQWVNSMPLFQWFRLEINAGTEEAVIGVLSKLYLEHRINISFNELINEIRREPLTVEEEEKWWEEHSVKLSRKRYGL